MKKQHIIYTLSSQPSRKEILSFVLNEHNTNITTKFYATKKEMKNEIIYRKWHILNKTGKFKGLGQIKQISINLNIMKIIINSEKI